MCSFYTCTTMHVCYSKFLLKNGNDPKALANFPGQSVPPLYQARPARSKPLSKRHLHSLRQRDLCSHERFASHVWSSTSLPSGYRILAVSEHHSLAESAKRDIWSAPQPRNARPSDHVNKPLLCRQVCGYYPFAGNQMADHAARRRPVCFASSTTERA